MPKKTPAQRAAIRFAKKGSLAAVNKTPYGYDVVKMASLAAAQDSAEYFIENMTKVQNFETRVKLIPPAVEMITVNPGLILEFGVASGRTINQIADLVPDRPVHGFDGFKGLPEDWNLKFRAGHFAQEIPEVRDNVELHVGWFEDTLPGFVEANEGPIALLHVDCDLYSSTKTIFQHLGSRLVEGSIILFDEYFNYPGWRQHEYKAFQELKAEIGFEYEYRAIASSHYQVAVAITKMPS